MKTFFLLPLFTLTLYACTPKPAPAPEPELEEEELITSGYPSGPPCDRLTYGQIMLNNGWQRMCTYSYKKREYSTPEKRQQDIDLGRKIYAEHYYEIIDTVNFTKNTKEFFENWLSLDTAVYGCFPYIYKDGKKIMVLHDYNNVRDFIVR